MTLPHFGQIGPSAITERAILAQEAGFDAVWVRDHLAFPAHRGSTEDAVFIDPFIALSAALTVAPNLSFGFATLIAHRHPIHAAGLLASLDFLTGPDRIVAGIGLGAVRNEFAAVGMGDWDRRQVVEEYVTVLRELWAGVDAHEGRYYRYQDIEIQPTPADGSIRISYCGSVPAGAERAARFCDAWGPVKVPLPVFEERARQVSSAAAKYGRDPVPLGISALVSVGDTPEQALAHPEVRGYVAWCERTYGAEIARAGDLGGVVIAGGPEEIVSGVRRYVDAGANHFLFDMRGSGDRWEDSVRTVGHDVLPALRGLGVVAATTESERHGI